MKTCSLMIIDDSEADRYLLKRMIKKLKGTADIFEAADGQAALDFLMRYDENLQQFGEGFPPLLIFLDINMPIMNGFLFLEAFAKLRADNSCYASSVFTMFTSSERDEDKQKVAAYDFVKGFIVKGSESPESLQQVIDDCLAHY